MPARPGTPCTPVHQAARQQSTSRSGLLAVVSPTRRTTRVRPACRPLGWSGDRGLSAPCLPGRASAHWIGFSCFTLPAQLRLALPQGSLSSQPGLTTPTAGHPDTGNKPLSYQTTSTESTVGSALLDPWIPCNPKEAASAYMCLCPLCHLVVLLKFKVRAQAGAQFQGLAPLLLSAW